MAEFKVHISQAKHNESLASFLIDIDKSYNDWAITVCFYSAIHYFEARLFIMKAIINERHSDTSVPLDDEGKQKYSVHRWREELIQDNFPQDIWKSYRKLRLDSELARYLTYPPSETEQPSYRYFQPSHSKKSLKNLENIKSGFNTELAEFLYDLGMDKSDQLQTIMIINKILGKLSTVQEVQDKTNLGFLSRNELKFLEDHLKSNSE